MNTERRLIIACSVVLFFMAALYASQRLDIMGWFRDVISPPPVSGAELAEGSVQQAIAVCQRTARAEIGSTLQHIKVDSLATRYVESSQTYIVFMNVVISGMEGDDTYVQCDVSAVSQALLRYRLNGPSLIWDFF